MKRTFPHTVSLYAKATKYDGPCLFSSQCCEGRGGIAWTAAYGVRIRMSKFGCRIKANFNARLMFTVSLAVRMETNTGT